MNRKNRRDRKKKERGDGIRRDDGWILFKRWLFCGIGVVGVGTPLSWAAHGQEWSGGMTVLCILGAGFFALGVFGSRKVVDEADITF